MRLIPISGINRTLDRSPAAALVGRDEPLGVDAEAQTLMPGGGQDGLVGQSVACGVRDTVGRLATAGGVGLGSRCHHDGPQWNIVWYSERIVASAPRAGCPCW